MVKLLRKDVVSKFSTNSPNLVYPSMFWGHKNHVRLLSNHYIALVLLILIIT